MFLYKINTYYIYLVFLKKENFLEVKKHTLDLNSERI